VLMIAVTQARGVDGQDLLDKQLACGKDRVAALRLACARLSDVVFRRPGADQRAEPSRRPQSRCGGC